VRKDRYGSQIFNTRGSLLELFTAHGAVLAAHRVSKQSSDIVASPGIMLAPALSGNTTAAFVGQ